MGLYIRKIGLPKDEPVVINGRIVCPIVVPSHGRLIDADELGLTDFEILMCRGEDPYKNLLKLLLEKIENAPTIIPPDKESK